MSAHAPLPPSRAEQWGNCSAWRYATAGRLERVNERTVRGTAAHWVAEECLKQWRDGPVYQVPSTAGWIGVTDPAGTLVDAEVAEGARYLVRDVLSVANRYGGFRFLLLEQRVSMARVHPTDNWGTLDVGLYCPDLGVLFIWDLKFGHSLVRARDNLQLADYAAGLCETFAIPLDTEVHLRIVQPFAYAPWGPVDEYVYPGLGHLIPLWDQLKAKALQSDTAPTMAGGTHCRYCPAREDCSGARQFAYLWGSMADLPYHIDVMSADDMARELDLLEGALATIKERAEAVNDALTARLQSGEPCNVKVLESVDGRLKWLDGMGDAATLAFGAAGVDIRKREPITPTQALNAAPKELQDVAKGIVGAMASRGRSLKLVDVADSLVGRAFGAKPTKGS